MRRREMAEIAWKRIVGGGKRFLAALISGTAGSGRNYSLPERRLLKRIVLSIRIMAELQLRGLAANERKSRRIRAKCLSARHKPFAILCGGWRILPLLSLKQAPFLSAPDSLKPPPGGRQVSPVMTARARSSGTNLVSMPSAPDSWAFRALMSPSSEVCSSM
jgi:hypothetical protein